MIMIVTRYICGLISPQRYKMYQWDRYRLPPVGK